MTEFQRSIEKQIDMVWLRNIDEAVQPQSSPLSIVILGVNAGLSRFNAPSSAVPFPVLPSSSGKSCSYQR
jgi:hypothetical protein